MHSRVTRQETHANAESAEPPGSRAHAIHGATDGRETASLTTRVGMRSDMGRQRDSNEDACLVSEVRLAAAGAPCGAGIYLVADGLGGHAAGEIAAALVVQAVARRALRLLPDLVSHAPVSADTQLAAVVVDLVNRANREVFAEARRRKNQMGSTLALALVVGDRCVVGNVGDTRTYLFRAGRLRRITQDHSLVMRLVELGQITEDEIYTHASRNVILRAVGQAAEVETDTFALGLAPGDALLLCTDGQWEMVRDLQMGMIVAAAAEPQLACDRLIHEANHNGGEDNITAVLVHFRAASEEAADRDRRSIRASWWSVR